MLLENIQCFNGRGKSPWITNDPLEPVRKFRRSEAASDMAARPARMRIGFAVVSQECFQSFSSLLTIAPAFLGPFEPDRQSWMTVHAKSGLGTEAYLLLTKHV